MKKIIYSFLTLSIIVLNSCSSELDELTTSDNSINLIDSKSVQVQAGSQNLQNARAIPSTYIVVFKESAQIDVDAESDKITKEHGGNKLFTYKHTIRGFASSNLTDKAVEAIKRNPNVQYVEQDQEVFAIATETPLSWGLDRIDQVPLPLSNTYTYTQTGSGVKAYIIDTGIKSDHVDLSGRVVKGIDVINNTFKDGNGHGTHVSGTVGGTKYGVAKKVTLVTVRVLNNQGSGTISGVIKGVDWATSNHVSGPAVANMSLGGGVSATLDIAVQKGIADGIVFCVAAGNSTADASTSSPARVPEAITVAASDKNDAFAYFSNYGTLVDIIAPGVNITSAWITSTTATNTISGTSMATPHVAGVAALYLSANPTATPSQVQATLKTSATMGKVTGNLYGTPNALLFSNNL
jgi:subtilisin family serine protease